jgi:glycosyltransferase involved in cell wall biosynthesis
VIQLLEDPALRAKMGAAGRQAAEQKFDLERNVDALMLAYGFQ